MSVQPNLKKMRRNEASGFTLIELMVVVVVIAILASIAYPSYQDAVRKSKRAQVKADMAELAQRYERFHTVNNTYVGFWAVAAGGAPGAAPGEGAKIISPNTTGATPAYQISSSGEAANAFTLTAVPQGRQQRDTLCGTLTLTHVGGRSTSGTGAISDCW